MEGRKRLLWRWVRIDGLQFLLHLLLSRSPNHFSFRLTSEAELIFARASTAAYFFSLKVFFPEQTKYLVSLLQLRNFESREKEKKSFYLPLPRDRSIHIEGACQLHDPKMTQSGLLQKGLTSSH